MNRCLMKRHKRAILFGFFCLFFFYSFLGCSSLFLLPSDAPLQRILGNFVPASLCSNSLSSQRFNRWMMVSGGAPLLWPALRSGTPAALLPLLPLLLTSCCCQELPNSGVNGYSLHPPYFNLAEGTKIVATATCGEDESGRAVRDLYCKLVGGPVSGDPGQTIQVGSGVDVLIPLDGVCLTVKKFLVSFMGKKFRELENWVQIICYFYNHFNLFSYFLYTSLGVGGRGIYT